MQTELVDDQSKQKTVSQSPACASEVSDDPSMGQERTSWLSRFMRRRHYWINWRSQLPATAMALSATLFFVVMFNWAMFEKTSARRAIIADVRPLVEQRLVEQDQGFHSFLIFLSVAFIICLVAGMVIFTHRSAGPVHRVRAHIRRVADGDMDCRVSLRTKDHFKELAEDFNQMLVALRERAEQNAEQLEALAARLQTPSPDVGEVASALTNIARKKAQVSGK